MGLIPGCNKDLVLVVEGLGYKPEGDGLNMCVHALQPKWLKPSPFVREVFFFFRPEFNFFLQAAGCARPHPAKMAQQWPSWKWKQWRIDLASSSDGLNKAARALGKGTTSKARQAKRAHLQPGASQSQDHGDDWHQDDGWDGGYQHGWSDDPWRRDDDGWWNNSWERGGWSKDSWERDDWKKDSWERDDWWESSWERDDSPPPGIHLELRSVSPHPRNRGSKSKRRERRMASSPSPGGWNRDRELGLPTISEPSGTSTPGKGKKQGKEAAAKEAAALTAW